MKSAIVLAAGLATAATSQTWSLSGTVRDIEDGSSVKNVLVRLARAGLSDSTGKEGKWSIGISAGVLGRPSAPNGINHTLSMINGHLQLQIDGRDILGRGIPKATPAFLQEWAGRTAGTVSDTLVYTKDGFVTKRVPIYVASQSGIVDSIRRIRYDGWVDSSHANRKADTLNGFLHGARTITLKWSKQSWDKMMKAMADSCGTFGTQGSGWGSSTSKVCSDGQNDYIEKTAMIWVPADVETDGQVWKNVGVRLKGNASLQTAWTTKNYALPFRFNTDKFEDSLPETKNQRFYGFQKISLYNNSQDSSDVRGGVAGAMYRQFGVPTPFSAPVHLILKFGDTTKDVGAYEMVEVPDEPLLSRWFGNDSGNLYKPLSTLEKYTASEWEDPDIPGDRSDAQALIAAINASNRTTDTAAWHRNLESKIDVDGFLKWLGATMVVMNWDSYGMFAHNYYLFNDKGRFRWITYDFGWSFDYVYASHTSIWYNESSGGFGMGGGTYPLIKNLLADKTYCEKYRSYVTQMLAGPGTVANFQSLVDKYGQWISSVSSTGPYVTKLRTFMTTRVGEVQTSLGNKTCPIQ